MPTLQEELSHIDEARTSAIQYIRDGKLAKAKRAVAGIRRSVCVVEGDRACALVDALILLQTKKKRRAKERLLQNNCAAWADAEILCALRWCNPAVSKTSALFKLTLQGGNATFGAFTQFGPQDACTLEIAANSQEQALGYAAELCRFALPDEVRVIDAEIGPLPAEIDCLGVVSTSPFAPVAKRRRAAAALAS